MLSWEDFMQAVGGAAKPPTRDGSFEARGRQNSTHPEGFVKKAENPYFCLKIERAIIIRPKII